MPFEPDSPIRVIIAENSKIVRLGLKLALEDFDDIRVVGEAGSHNEAYRMLADLSPEIIMMNVPPANSGENTLKQIREHFPRTRMIILTAEKNQDDVIQTMQSGAGAYCLKSISTDELAHVVRLVNRGGIWVDPGIADHVRHLIQRQAAGLKQRNNTDGTSSAGGLVKKPHLSRREKQILQLLVEGKNNQEIANTLDISIHTVKAAISSILKKTTATDRVQLVIMAIRHEFV